MSYGFLRYFITIINSSIKRQSPLPIQYQQGGFVIYRIKQEAHWKLLK